MKIIVNSEKCPQDHRCPAMDICPVEAISQKDVHSLPVIDSEICIRCKRCVRMCPKKAFEEAEDSD